MQVLWDNLPLSENSKVIRRGLSKAMTYALVVRGPMRLLYVFVS